MAGQMVKLAAPPPSLCKFWRMLPDGIIRWRQNIYTGEDVWVGHEVHPEDEDWFFRHWDEMDKWDLYFNIEMGKS
jgi:hypothetical protein